MADDENFAAAKALAKNVFLIDEFIANEIDKGAIGKELFTKEKRLIKLHGHCQQKALSSTAPSVKIMSLPENYSVETIPSGCCGMAGSKSLTIFFRYFLISPSVIGSILLIILKSTPVN